MSGMGRVLSCRGFSSLLGVLQSVSVLQPATNVHKGWEISPMQVLQQVLRGVSSDDAVSCPVASPAF
jgi:hypothetical protein